VIKNWFNKVNFVGKIANYVSAHPRGSKIISVLILVAIVPLTVITALRTQHYRQYASTCLYRGDANGDGKVDAADVEVINRAFLGLKTYKNGTPFQLGPGADANGSGNLTTADVDFDKIRSSLTAADATRAERIGMGLEPLVCVPDPKPEPTGSGGSSGGSSSNSSGNSGSSSNNSNNSNNPSGCGDMVPVGVPNLFQINVNSTTVTLYYTPLISNVTDYYIFYGEKPGASQFSASTKQGKSSGVLSYSINYLNPNSTYYFRIRGQNGCMPGEWSNEMKILTGFGGSNATVIYYKNGEVKSDVIIAVVSVVPTISMAMKPTVTATVVPTATITVKPSIIESPVVTKSVNRNISPRPKKVITLTPSPMPTPHKRMCFLWWCW
jgi:hypothetical protein